ncbi:unnamed protein product [Zymoseptoria tritici ST99CH_3D7]|uniref:Uncharacterized protein n=1 Tax=Zymoseptoria tritici (strain ST99CH_3D7) TaxID=1276538 RepID=A0A1X7S9J5_ZYMT9|nr:unnamed protein product [Zymoseptoria tritici ST99CH_3D7]
MPAVRQDERPEKPVLFHDAGDRVQSLQTEFAARSIRGTVTLFKLYRSRWIPLARSMQSAREQGSTIQVAIRVRVMPCDWRGPPEVSSLRCLMGIGYKMPFQIMAKWFWSTAAIGKKRS